MGSSCEGDAFIFCCLLGFAVNSFDRPPQLGTVGPVVYALYEFSLLSSLVILCRLGDLIIHCRQPKRGGILLLLLFALGLSRLSRGFPPRDEFPDSFHWFAPQV